ncbi:hypothetical protein [Brachybacterium sp. GU-2]|uniref:hypothetical protein n=1 Tax=Brachybacterium sp. GU-2 TaxID=3069708 RepID=UPI00280B7EE8|nr:hypothetical protein [Brachybacterium sp. GU-2]WME24452.1 hypothetical protein RBL05_07060 [Brachybacterium sp. GU-2]
MSRPTTPTPTAPDDTASRARAIAGTASRHLLPFAVGFSAASLWLLLIAVVTEAIGSTLLVLALAILPGAVIMGVSRRERTHWAEYVLVWIGFFIAVPLYGVILLVGGYGIVLARAWHRHRLRSIEPSAD